MTFPGFPHPYPHAGKSASERFDLYLDILKRDAAVQRAHREAAMGFQREASTGLISLGEDRRAA